MKPSKQSLPYAVALVAFFAPRVCQSQFSSYSFNNYFSDALAPVFDASGDRLSGTNYVAVLYGGPSPDALQLGGRLNTLVPMAPVPFIYKPNGLDGYFNGGGVVVNSMNCGGFAWLQVRAWDARLGATYDDVAKLGLGGYGQSNLFEAAGGDPYPCLPPGDQGVPKPMIGLQSFSL